MNLLSPNDLTQLRRAVQCAQEVQLTRTMNGFVQTVSVVPASKVWECDVLVRLEKCCGHIYTTQYFKSVEQMEEYL